MFNAVNMADGFGLIGDIFSPCKYTIPESLLRIATGSKIFSAGWKLRREGKEKNNSLKNRKINYGLKWFFSGWSGQMWTASIEYWLETDATGSTDVQC
jgi:hypothetical protein